MKPFLPVCVAALLSASAVLHAQAIPAAVKTGDIKVGGALVLAHPDYSPKNEAGFSLFADVDLAAHIGVEFQFHNLGGSDSDSVAETTYEVGARLPWTFRPYLPGLGRREVTPFIKGDFGAGTFRFQNKPQNATYGIYGAGGGIDLSLVRHLDGRLEYEYQRWASFNPNGLQPNLLTIGVAYRIR